MADSTEETRLKHSRMPRENVDPARLTQRIVNLFSREVNTYKKHKVLKPSDIRALTDILKSLVALQREQRASADEEDLGALNEDQLNALVKQVGDTIDE